MLGILGVFIGGGIGSLLRYWVCGRICNHWGVMLVNVIGAFVIGMVFHYFNPQRNPPGSQNVCYDRFAWRVYDFFHVYVGFWDFDKQRTAGRGCLVYGRFVDNRNRFSLCRFVVGKSDLVRVFY